MVTTAPYGSWASPITARSLVEAAVALGQVRRDGDDLYWLEGRPMEAGRLVVVRRTPDGQTVDAIPAAFSARTRVHEYGGASYLVRDGTIWFANFADQRVYRVAGTQDAAAVAPVTPVTPAPAVPAGMRFADMAMTPDNAWIIAVRETHSADGDVVNDIAAFRPDGDGT